MKFQRNIIKSRVILALLLLTLGQSAMAQTMVDYLSPAYQSPNVDLNIEKDYTFIVPQQTKYLKGDCLSYHPKSISGNFTLILDKSPLIKFAKNFDTQTYQLLQKNVDFTNLDKFGCYIIYPKNVDNEPQIEALFQTALSAGKTTILNEHGRILPQATIVYVAYYQMGSVIYKIDNFVLWLDNWYMA